MNKHREFDAASIIEICKSVLPEMAKLSLDDRVRVVNEVRKEIHHFSPFKDEPVDFVEWVKFETVTANDYNPNSVAPPEMELLRHSITADGYTQPIVTWGRDGIHEVVDGFHRHRVGRECEDVTERIRGYLPVVSINSERMDRSDRIASTIRHNRARGKHKVEAMSDIVVELKRRNWSDEKIGRELGMDPDEVLRLCQITGLAEMFKDHQFSEAWEAEKQHDMSMEVISDILPDFEADDGGRIYHTWEKWECYKAGFYDESPSNQEEGEEKYRLFLSDLGAFEAALLGVTDQWKNSCEHYLTNDRMNRIAWLGQASVCFALGVPSCCRGGYNLLTETQKAEADELALKYLNIWLSDHGRDAVTFEQAGGRTKAELY